MKYDKSSITDLDTAKAYSPKGACPKGYTLRTTTSNTYQEPPCVGSSGGTIYDCNLNGGLSTHGHRIDINVPIMLGLDYIGSGNAPGPGVFTDKLSDKAYWIGNVTIGSLHVNLS